MVAKLGVVAFVIGVLWILKRRSQGHHPKCKDMSSYQASYVAAEYKRSRHMGHFYELAFRDLYVKAPYCDCQHTYKVPDTEHSYHEDFEQRAMGLGRMASVLNMNETGEANGTIFRQSISWSNPNPPIPGIKDIGYNTGVIAYKTVPGQDQYEWVLEFTCDTHDPWSLRALFEDGFVGINMYSRSGPKTSSNLAEMVAAAKDLGLGWVLDNTWGWGFHEVPHENCSYNPPSVQEFACVDGTCSPVRWGAGNPLAECNASCSKEMSLTV